MTQDMSPRTAVLMEATRDLIAVSRQLCPELPDAFRKGQVFSALLHFTGPTDRFDCFDLVNDVCEQEGIK
ncbi:MAG: hypothetical protein CL859_11380 [Cyanobium sp. ARS6]|nr:hypothetical protein [Cyanobium sp. ARS6]